MAEHPTEERPFRILFVCTGNTCRSPMAESIARARAEQLGWKHVEVASAGVAAFAHAPASDGALEAAIERGHDLSAHAATPLTPGLADGADLILTMSPAHLARVEELGAAERSQLITLYGPNAEAGGSSSGVLDPYGGSVDDYLRTFDQLDGLVEGVFRSLAPALDTAVDQ